MTLELNGLEVSCIIGERADERVHVQTLRVDVSLEVSDDAARTDELDDAVDYAALAEAIRRTLVEARCRMIERAARLVAETCLADGKVRRVRAAVTKSGAVAGLASATAVWTAASGTEAQA